MSSSVDLRGFTYQLDPVQKQTQWKLDILEIALQPTSASCTVRQALRFEI